MSQAEDVERYRTMKVPDWISVSNSESAAFDPGFVESIRSAFASGLLHSDGPYPLCTGASEGIFGGPSISGIDKVA
jgi:hypothetical protein